MSSTRRTHPIDLQRGLDAYADIDLFRGVDLEQARHLLATCAELEVQSGDGVLEAGTDNDAVYLVMEGELEVRFGGAHSARVTGVGPGACVGELSILSRLEVSAHVIASRPSRLLQMPADTVWAFITLSHEFATNLLRLLSGRVLDDNARLQRSLDQQQRYRRAAKTDALTGLYNRRWFDQVLTRQWQRAVADDVALCMLFIDIDHFKQVNDVHGHLVGDQALRAVADLLLAGIRPVDLAARFGGEEFAVVLLGVNLDEAREIAERLRRDIAARILPAPTGPTRITASIGVAQLAAGERVAELLAACDAAMYAAKQGGRDRVVVRAVTAQLRSAGQRA